MILGYRYILMNCYEDRRCFLGMSLFDEYETLQNAAFYPTESSAIFANKRRKPPEGVQRVLVQLMEADNYYRVIFYRKLPPYTPTITVPDIDNMIFYQ